MADTLEAYRLLLNIYIYIIIGENMIFNSLDFCKRPFEIRTASYYNRKFTAEFSNPIRKR